MPQRWVPPSVFMRLVGDSGGDNVVFYAYKDGQYNHVLLYIYNTSYYEDEISQFDVRDLIPKLEKLGLSLSDERRLQRCIEGRNNDNGTRTWHKGVIRLAFRHGLLP